MAKGATSALLRIGSGQKATTAVGASYNQDAKMPL